MDKSLGVTRFFYGFLNHLSKERHKIASLQLSGRLEDYLVHEFIYYVYSSSNGSRFAFTNMGKANEQKVDIVIASGSYEKKSIKAMIEAKYLRNRHRFSKSNAEDEITTTLRSLKKQLHKFEESKHAGLTVKLSSKRQDIYGLVFASYVGFSQDETRDDKERFFSKCLNEALKLGFRYHDLHKPYWRTAFEDEKVKALKINLSISLRAGLWRLSSPEQSSA
ncbi:MAG: hypothetical protein LC128_08330 [Chitinophagales bacterium]|nr:hypothetical protein [Chitinophagales bacterium]